MGNMVVRDGNEYEENAIYEYDGELGKDKDYPPVDCDCGGRFKYRSDMEFENGCMVGFKLRCCKCKGYLGTFEYGKWSY